MDTPIVQAVINPMKNQYKRKTRRKGTNLYLSPELVSWHDVREKAKNPKGSVSNLVNRYLSRLKSAVEKAA